jgi:hypothetical protein
MPSVLATCDCRNAILPIERPHARGRSFFDAAGKRPVTLVTASE